MSHEQHGDVITMSKRGQWVNRVEGEEELSQGYATKEEAIEAGRLMAEEVGARHRVVDAEPTGVVTDEDEDSATDASAGQDRDEDSDDDVIAVEDLP